MAWTPISGTPPQFSTAANALAQDYYLKFYASGTTTPINMATDSTGGTQLAQCALSDDGYPITNPLDDTTKFIPHIDQNYRIVLYKNKTDADNNTTANAAFNIDGLVPNVAPSADAADITLKDSNVQIFDDYDRSPIFVDGTDFTAGAGPHVITVPAGWTPTNADVRFYKKASNGVITVLTPTAKTSTTFTIADTLLSTDEVFIGDDTFRNQFDGDPADARGRLDTFQKSQNLADAVVATVRSNIDVYSTGETVTEINNRTKITTQIFTSSGTWTKPAGCRYVEVEVQANGGNGGSALINDSGGAGGGSGGYARAFVDVTAISSETVTIGTGTGTTSFGSYASATGGADGPDQSTTNNATQGGAGGTATAGDVQINGNRGGNSRSTTTGDSYSGYGANSVLGIGAPGRVIFAGSSGGEDATGYGAGGAGGVRITISNAGGGSGSPAIVIVKEFY